MSETKKNEVKRVKLAIPRGAANEDPNVLIGINGVNYILPRGKTSEVPDYVAEEYHRAQRAQEAQDESIDRMRSAGK